jgi:prepilin-type N-terminal cleavage/methylation domain-containing protein
MQTESLIMKRTRPARGFTLIEILIVVAILGIISSIVVPQVSITSREARATQVSSQLQMARTQVMYFKARTGAFPESITSGTDWSDMIDGGYFPRAPRNALRGNATGVIAGNGGPGADASAGDTVGWYWCIPLEVLYAIDDAGIIVDEEVGLNGPRNGGGPYVDMATSMP